MILTLLACVLSLAALWFALAPARARHDVRLLTAGVAHLAPKPGDVVVVRLHERVPKEVAESIERQARAQLGGALGCGVVVLNDGMSLEVATPAPTAGELADVVAKHIDSEPRWKPGPPTV